MRYYSRLSVEDLRERGLSMLQGLYAPEAVGEAS